MSTSWAGISGARLSDPLHRAEQGVTGDVRLGIVSEGRTARPRTPDPCVVRRSANGLGLASNPHGDLLFRIPPLDQSDDRIVGLRL